MNYFVGCVEPEASHPNASWLVPQSIDMPPREGDGLFLIEWAKDGGRLVSYMILSGLRPHEAAFEIVPDVSYRLPGLPIPEAMLSDLPRMHEADDRQIDLVDGHTGRSLHRISAKYLRSKRSTVSMGKQPTRTAREKTPEKQIKTIEKKAKSRLGQADFREALIVVYESCCAISGCSVDAVLSAAHIWDYSLSQCQEVWNGILLRADLHLLFDRHLLRIFPGNPPIVMLDTELQQSETYKHFHLQALRLPKSFDDNRTNGVLRGRWDAANRDIGRFPDPQMIGGNN